MGAPENEHIYGLGLRESANDGSDFSNPDADYRVFFLGEDGLIHVKDSAGAVTSPYSSGNSLSRTLVYRATGQTITGSGTQTIISYSDEVEDDAGCWAIGNPTKLVIPAGLNGRKGRVYAQVAFTGSSSGTFRRARILLGGSEHSTVTTGVSGTTAEHLQVETQVVTFATSDEWTVGFNADVAGMATIGGLIATRFGLYTVD